MKVCRTVIYATAPFMPGHKPPVTMVMRDIDMTVPPEEAHTHIPGQFAIYDIFEMPGAPPPAAAFKAGERALERRREEDDMATSYFWNTAMLSRVNANGTLTNPRPAPLTGAQLRHVFEQIALHPNYENQTLLAISARDGSTVRLVEGRAIVDPAPTTP